MTTGPDTEVIDTGMFGLPNATAVFLVSGRKAALVDAGAASTSEKVIARLEGLGVSIETILLTHIHFDHAGGAGHLLDHFPDATVHVHRRVAKHLVDPSRLQAGVRSVWGDRADALFGSPLPIPEDRVRALDDGDSIDLGDRTVTAYSTPGHTRAHLSFLDESNGELFCGDALGVQIPGCSAMRPATPPADHDLGEALGSIRRIEGLGASSLLLGHYGPATGSPGETCTRASEALTRWREAYDRVRLDAADEEDAVRQLNCALEADLEPARPNCRRKMEAINPVWLNVQGMALDAARIPTGTN